MTLSVPRRKADVKRTLAKLVAVIGDDYLLEHDFSLDDPRFADVLPTTWRELVDAGFAETDYRAITLTPSGWIAGLRYAGLLESPDLRSRAVAMVRALKARVKGRHELHDELTDTRELAAELEIPEGWVTNALRANLLQAVFPKDRMNAKPDSQYPSLIRIPPTFNSDPIEVD